MNIRKVTVLIDQFRSDTLILQTDLPPSVWPYRESPTLRLEVARGSGIAYAQTNFPEAVREFIDLDAE